MAKKKLLIAAVVVGLFAVALMYLYASQINEEKEQLLRDQVEVVKAARNIPAGTPLSKDRITTEEVPQRYLPPNPLLQQDLNIYLGQPLAVNVEQGAMILTSDFSVEEISRTLSSKVPVDERAMTIPVDPVSGLAGLLRPGDRVDLLGTFPVGSKEQMIEDASGKDNVGYITMPLLQNVTLLATGGLISDVTTDNRSQGQYNTVTLSVTVDEAELLTITQTRGTLMLLLRNRDDVNVGPVTQQTLKGVLKDLNIIAEKRAARVRKTIKKPDGPVIERQN